MKLETRCPKCGKGYLIDESRIPTTGGFVPCQVCGTTIALSAKAAASKPPGVRRAASVSPSGTPAAPGAPGEVCCPRCQFHFVPGAPAPKPASGRHTLLIVEDMEYFVQMAQDALSSRYEVKIAKTLGEAQALLGAGGIDLLLLDLTLERGEDGLRLLREPPGKVCPVLLFTAQDESEMYGDAWAKLRALGVDDVIIKGMNMDEALQRKVAEMLGDPAPEDALSR